MAGSGMLVGPATAAAPRAGSNSAPWQGQASSRLPLS